MTHDIDAIFDNGVFRPLAPVAIPEGVRVHLRVDEQIATDASANKMSRVEMDEFLRVMAELPIESPDDGFSGADHDQLLYGKL